MYRWIKYNPNLKNTKFESTEAAIKRGVVIQTSFLSKREMKAKAELNVSEGKKDVAENDMFNAETYRQMQLIGFIMK